MTPSNEEENAQLGLRLRELRRARKLTLRALASRAGLSASYLSQIENGNANVTIQSLRKLASIFGIGWADFFAASEASGRVLKRADRRSLMIGEGQRDYGIAQLPLVDVDVGTTEYDPGVTVGDENYVHEDLHEIVVVLRGEMRLVLDGVTYDLVEGDSADFRSSTPHMLTNIGDSVAECLWVTCPPAGTTHLHIAPTQPPI